MMTLFISDLHLEADRPDISDQFLAFLDGEARDVDALYILGDLFEVWLGDDDPNPYHRDMKLALRALSIAGVPIFFMHGNRDFMIGPQFATETGVTILDDPTIVNIYGRDVLLSHGDALCTDDVEYQQVRTMTRDPEWQSMMLAKTIAERTAFAVQAREQSIARASAVGEASIHDDIMDVNQDAVVSTLLEHGVDTLLHGHTHRPAVHDVDLGKGTATRIVLGDWYEQGSVVRWDQHGPRLEVLPRS